ncbi:MAG: shikimate dehydrogenase [Bacillota bacterium]|nr:shikimate dehydrogenase [Bacillota bacterium]
MAESGMLPELGVIGWPLDMTFSPAMHEAALKEAGLGWRYQRIPVAPHGLDDFMKTARATMRGVNVTMPHKHAVAEMCSQVDTLSSLSGAVNTVVFGNGAGLDWTGQTCPAAEPPTGSQDVPFTRGFNTDGPGLLRALAERAAFEPDGKTVMVLGSGGSAGACAAQMALSGARELVVVNRTLSRAEALCARMSQAFPRTGWTPLDPVGHNLASGDSVGAGGAEAALEAAVERADLILSCVPAAGHDAFTHIIQRASPGTVFVDLAYSSSPTGLHVLAQQAGLRPVPGLEMLLWQAALSFEIFTGASAPVDAMHRALVNVAGGWWSEC